MMKLEFPARTALMPFLMAGDPSLAATEEIIISLAGAGADLIELGVPHSDPLADGPINQKAAARALASGTTLDRILALVARLRKRGVELPILLLSYLNPLLAKGEALFPALEESGIQGLIIPDLPPEQEMWFTKGRTKLPLIRFLAPTTTKERIPGIVEGAEGFLYCVSTTGVTGPKGEVPAGLASFLAEGRNYSSLPRVVGFGISSPQQAKEVGKLAEGVIVGSALVEILAKEGMEAGVNFVRELRAALDS